MKFWPFTTRSHTVQPHVRKTPTIRSYNAAGNVARYADFKRSSGSADAELINGLAPLREKARSLARNSPTMSRYIQLMQVNIVGESGFQFRSRVKRADGAPDKTLNSRVEMAWWRFMQAPTVDGQMMGIDVMNQMVESWARDGEYLIEYVVGPFGNDLFALNPLEADMLDETLNTIHPATGNQIRMGVEIDEYSRPVAYHMHVQHPGDPGWYVGRDTGINRHRRVPASKILHLYKRKRPGQTRGEPPTATIINSIKMLDGYREAEVTGRRIQSAVMGFFKRDLPGPSGIDALASNPDDDDTSPLLQMDLEPGTFKELPPGMSFEKFEATGATTDYAQFEGQLKRDQAMGVGVSAFSLGMETQGVSYSTGRTVVIEDRDHYRAMQQFFIAPWRKIFKEWLKYHILTDMSSVPPTRVPAVLDTFTFRGRGWAWVDPAKDIKANAEALRTRQTSLSRIAADRGVDFEDLLLEIAADEAMLAEHNISITIVEPLPEADIEETETLQPDQ